MARSVGVEEEFLLVQQGSAMLAPVGEAVVRSATVLSDGQFEHELKREQAELGSAPHWQMASLADDLQHRRRELASAARSNGVRLLASGTSPVDAEVSTTSVHRYEEIAQTYGELARTQLTCGMHIHVLIESRDEGVHVLDRVRRWLPALVALSANSPFRAGQDTAHASYRTVMWGVWPSSGTVDLFGDLAGYDAARRDVIESGAALDEAMIYFDARLSERYPTIEFRVCDVVADVRDSVTIAALTRALVETAAAQTSPPQALRSEMLRAARWRAARYGMQGQLFDPGTASLVPAADLVGLLVDWVRPALEDSGDLDLVTDGLARIVEHGTGERLQREAFARGGFESVVDELVAVTSA